LSVVWGCFFVTAIAVTIGSVVQHERLSVPQIAGAAVIISGCALVLGLVPAVGRRRAGSQLAPPHQPCGGPPVEPTRSAASAPVAQDP
jgi:cytochrome c biogenesis protein CcdA